MSREEADQCPVICDLCPHDCRLQEGQRGFCQARGARGGQVLPLYYGKLCSLALDPIEKKPLHYFFPGSRILSAGNIGCNMNCPGCQNADIARPESLESIELHLQNYSAEKLVELAEKYRARGNIGLAFTYNEPLINFEFVLSTCELARKHGLKTVLISNGQIRSSYLEKLLPHVDAWNLDLKCFSEAGYRQLGGDFATVLETIERAQAVSHVEVTSLIVPGFNDGAAEMHEQAAWLASLNSAIPLHLSRFFPCRRLNKLQPTPINCLRALQSVAAQYLQHVRLGNVAL